MGLIIAVYLLASRRAISGILGKLVVAILPERHVNRFVMFFKRLYTDFAAFSFQNRGNYFSERRCSSRY